MHSYVFEIIVAKYMLKCSSLSAAGLASYRGHDASSTYAACQGQPAWAQLRSTFALKQGWTGVQGSQECGTAWADFGGFPGCDGSSSATACLASSVSASISSAGGGSNFCALHDDSILVSFDAASRVTRACTFLHDLWLIRHRNDH